MACINGRLPNIEKKEADWKRSDAKWTGKENTGGDAVEIWTKRDVERLKSSSELRTRSAANAVRLQRQGSGRLKDPGPCSSKLTYVSAVGMGSFTTSMIDGVLRFPCHRLIEHPPSNNVGSRC